MINIDLDDLLKAMPGSIIRIRRTPLWFWAFVAQQASDAEKAKMN